MNLSAMWYSMKPNLKEIDLTHAHDAVAALPSPSADVRMIVLRHAHHAKASGYDRLVDYIRVTPTRPRDSWSFGERAITKLLQPLVSRSGLQWYHRSELLAELRAARSWYAPGRRIYHFLYGENSYRYLGILKRTRGNPVVCTFHTPRHRFLEVVRTKRHLRDLDACIVLTTEMRDFFADFIAPERVFYVPHGVDTAYFCPPTERFEVQSDPECLAVGSHMRDFDALYDAARYLAANAPEVRLTIVAGKDDPGRFANLPNVNVRRNVSDAELLELYRRATVFLLAVREVTANNALLEAIACGLPVIATDLPGVRDYVDAKCAKLTEPGNGVAIGEAVLSLLDNSRELDAMRKASRSRALQFDWKEVAKQVMHVYEGVF